MSAYDVLRSLGEPTGFVHYGTRVILSYGETALGVPMKFVFENDKLVDVQYV